GSRQMSARPTRDRARPATTYPAVASPPPTPAETARTQRHLWRQSFVGGQPPHLLRPPTYRRDVVPERRSAVQVTRRRRKSRRRRGSPPRTLCHSTSTDDPVGRCHMVMCGLVVNPCRAS